MKSKVGGHDNAKSMHIAQAEAQAKEGRWTDSSFVTPKPKARAKGRLTDSNVIKRTAEELGRSKEQIMVLIVNFYC